MAKKFALAPGALKLKRTNKFETLLGKSLLPFSLQKDGITQSLITSWRTCQRKARLSLGGVYKVQDESYALVFGTVFHEYLDVLYTGIKVGRITELKDVKNEIELATIYMIETRFAERISDAKVGKHYTMAIAVCSGMVHQYMIFWGKDFFGSTQKHWVALEDEFSHSTSEYTVRGKIDGAYDDAEAALWLFETKTKGQINEAGLSQMIERDLQVNLYLNEIETKFGRDAKGVLYNIIRRPALKQKKDETDGEFALRCVSDVKERPEFYFLRLEVKILPKQREEFSRRFEHELSEFVRWFKQDPLLDSESTHNCVGAYGPCKYIGLCSGSSCEGYGVKSKHHSELSGKEGEEA